jgi:hypothetical protein
MLTDPHTHTHKRVKGDRRGSPQLFSGDFFFFSFTWRLGTRQKKERRNPFFLSFLEMGRKSQGEQQSVRCERCEDVGGRRHVDAIAEPDRSRTWSSTAIQTDGCVRRVCAIEANLPHSSRRLSTRFPFFIRRWRRPTSAPHVGRFET